MRADCLFRACEDAFLPCRGSREEGFTERACDGFVVGPTYLPGTFEEFVRLVIPELQRRGVYRKEYAGTTLRDPRGLVCPEGGAWRH
jgi:hypothetical protein